jgi:hypothetical protein
MLRKSFNSRNRTSTIAYFPVLLLAVAMSNSLTAAAKQSQYSERGKSTSYACSETSYYTTEEKKDSYQTLGEVLDSKCSDPSVRTVIQDLMKVCADITEALRVALVTVEGTTNDFGDSQLSVDVSFGLV